MKRRLFLTVVPSQVGAFGPVVPIELLSLGCLDQR
jgi:hypothetical protein